MDLFHLQEEAPGMVFWHAKGWSIYVALQNYIRNKQIANGYDEINTPLVVDRNFGKPQVTGTSIVKICSSQKLMKSMPMRKE